jgi:hypothetical protein
VTTWSTTETVITWQSQDDASITFQIVKQTGGGGGGGTGDVVGPSSSVDGRAVLFDGTTGKLIKQASAAPMLVGDAPTAHAASHQDGGSDELALDASQTTTGQFNVARLGTGTPTVHTFLNGLGEWTYDVPVFVPVKNTTASTIAKGTPVYATGTVGATSTIEIAPADADDAAKMPAIGLTETSLSANATGFVVVVGTLRGVDTNAYSINAPLYVSTTAGQLTGTKPTGTSDAIQMIALVTRVNSSNGEVLVLAQGSDEAPNAIDAGKITSGTIDNARLDTELQALASTTSAANALPYFTGSGTATTTTLTSAGRALIDDADAAAQRTTLGLATIASSGSASDLSTGTVPSARLALPLRRLAASGISYTSPTELFGTPPTDIQGNVTTSALAAGTMRLSPCDIAGGPTLASIAFEVSASGLNAGQSVSIGCYARASTGLPTGTPVWTLTQTVGTTTGTYVVSTTNTLPENGCWLALLNPSGNAGTVTIYIYQPTGPYLLALRSLTTRPALISTTGISSLPDVSSYTVSNAASAGVWSVSQQGVLFMLR